MKVAAIFLNWCTPMDTIECVKSFQQICPDVDQIYVIDNASPDDSMGMMKSALTNCKIVRNNVNSGYTGGNNFGMQLAFESGNDVVLIFNSDLVFNLKNNFISSLRKIIKRNSDCILGISVHDLASDNVTYPVSAGYAVGKLIKNINKINGSNTFPLVCGCALVIPKKVYSKIGSFDESLFMYCEELDYSIRASLNNFEILALPEYFGHVQRDESPRTRKPYVYYYQSRNAMRLISKYCHNNLLYVRSIFFASLFISSLRTKCLRNVFCTLLGIKDGLIGVHGKNESKYMIF